MTTQGQQTNDGYFPSLSGLRGVAALIVLVSHFSNATGWLGTMLGRGGGQLGVMLFFVLSAYLMMAMYHDNRQSPLRFLWNRFARVYPLYAVAVVASAALGASATWANFLDVGPSKIVTHLSFQTTSSVLWTIGPEMFFYLGFAALLLTPRTARAWLIVAIAAMTILTWGSVNPRSFLQAVGLPGPLVNPSHVYKFFVIGLLLYFSVRLVPTLSGKIGFVATTTIIVAIVINYPMVHLAIFGDKLARNGWDSLPTAVAIVAALIGALRIDPLRTILSSRLLVFLGNISFSVYLFHMLAIRLLRQAGLLYPHFWSLALVIALTVLIASATYYLVETPARRVLRSLPDTIVKTARREAQGQY